MKNKLKKIFSEQYSNKLLDDFFIKTQKLYEHLGYDFNLNRHNEVVEVFNVPYVSNNIWLNDDYINSTVSNCEFITFDMFYPKIISKIAQTNLENFNKVFSELIDMYYFDKDVSVKKYINMTYGCLQNEKNMIYSKNIKNVPIIADKIINNFVYKFKENIIFIDTDTICFRNFDTIKKEFDFCFEKINKYNLTYVSKKSKFGFFVSPKRYIYENNGNININGLKFYNNNEITTKGFIFM